jgi:hypothetical protein
MSAHIARPLASNFWGRVSNVRLRETVSIEREVMSLRIIRCGAPISFWQMINCRNGTDQKSHL